MNYQISRAGQTIGTYDLEALKAAAQAGQVLPTDFAWTPGMTEWKAVSIVLAGQPLPPGQGSAVSSDCLRAVASNHRAMNLCLLFSLLCIPLFAVLSGAAAAGAQSAPAKQVVMMAILLGFYGILFALFIFWCVKVYKLADALQAGPAFLWVLGMFVPCLSYVFVLILSQKASGFLKSNGVKVGFLGADSSTVP